MMYTLERYDDYYYDYVLIRGGVGVAWIAVDSERYLRELVDAANAKLEAESAPQGAEAGAEAGGGEGE